MWILTWKIVNVQSWIVVKQKSPSHFRYLSKVNLALGFMHIWEFIFILLLPSKSLQYYTYYSVPSSFPWTYPGEYSKSMQHKQNYFFFLFLWLYNYIPSGCYLDYFKHLAPINSDIIEPFSFCLSFYSHLLIGPLFFLINFNFLICHILAQMLHLPATLNLHTSALIYKVFHQLQNSLHTKLHYIESSTFFFYQTFYHSTPKRKLM